MAGRTLVQQGEVWLDGRLLRYRVRRIPRRRHVHLQVGDDAVIEVRAPYRFSDEAARSAIHANAAWLNGALARAAQRRSERPALVDGAVLPFLDEQLELRLRDPMGTSPVSGRRAAGRAWRQACRLHVWCPDDNEQVLRSLLCDWYRRQARDHLEVRLRLLAPRLSVQPSSISIRAQKTRWGSCSSRGVISLNWRLMLVPGHLADYVLVHELCHLRHLDHSPAFWSLVASVLPEHRRLRAELRDIQGRLPL